MYITKEAVAKILGIRENAPLRPEEMASSLTIIFFPHHDKNKVSKEVLEFGEQLKKAFLQIGVKVVPYKEALIKFPIRKLLKIYFLLVLSIFVSVYRKILKISDISDRLNFSVISRVKRGQRIRPGVSVVALGENETGNLPMDYTMSFTRSSVITILDMPPDIHSDSEFHKHFDVAMDLFSRHMTNIAIIVDHEKWILYNFNASHPIFPRDKDFAYNVLHALVPKIAAPIKPPRLSEFLIQPNAFDLDDEQYRPFIVDFLESGTPFAQTELYPPGKKLRDLPFRNEYYQWIGRLHLDDRSGMSYGFLARQLPVKLPTVFDLEIAEKKFGQLVSNNPRGYFIFEGQIYVILYTPRGSFCVAPPDVWVLTQRSGSDKTKIDPHKDIIKLGLVRGSMVMQTPRGLKLMKDYKPSFDTKVILAHALSNGIIGALLKHLEPSAVFPRALENHGVALAHWHGYMNPDFIPEGWHTHGLENAPVPCSSPQSAIYAFQGNLGVFMESLKSAKEYRGNIHIEPHHGTNISFSSLKELAEFLKANPNASKLGNYYLRFYGSKAKALS